MRRVRAPQRAGKASPSIHSTEREMPPAAVRWDVQAGIIQTNDVCDVVGHPVESFRMQRKMRAGIGRLVTAAPTGVLPYVFRFSRGGTTR